MTLTLSQAALLSTDTLQRGVITTFAQSSPILEMLPFMDVSGNSYKYNVEKALPGIAFRDVNAGYTASSGEVEQRFESLVILGGDSDVDRFIVNTRGNVNEIRAIHTQMKAKALAKQFTKQFFKGDAAAAADANHIAIGFDGLDARLVGTSQELDNTDTELGGTGGKLTLNALHTLLDQVNGGADALFMGKAMRRELQKLLEGQTHYVQVGKDSFGRPIEMFGDVQIRTVEDELLPIDATNGGDIYAIKFGAMDAVSGLQNGGVSVRDLGELDTLPVYRTRIEWYVSMAKFHPKAAARLKGILR